MAVTGATTLSSSLAVTGATTLSSTLDVAGETTVTNINFNNILRGVGDSNIHLVGGGDTYIMARRDVIIYKNPTNADWKNPSGNLVVQNNLTVSGQFKYNGALDFLPSGCIIMWHSNENDVPPGWSRTNMFDNKFPRGSTYTGGEGGSLRMNTSFYISVAQMPRHRHSASIASMGTEQKHMDGQLASDRGWNRIDYATYTNYEGDGHPVYLAWDAQWQPYRNVVFIQRN